MELSIKQSKAICSGFLIGIVIHSLDPYRARVSFTGVIVFLICLYILWKFKQVALLIFLGSMMIGIIRFEYQSNLPGGLIPLDPKGLTSVSHEVHRSNRTDPRFWLSYLRAKLSARSDQLFTRTESALVKGILWGEKIQDFKLKKSMRDAGLSHLTAISGANISWVLSFLLPTILSFGIDKRKAFWIGTLCIIAFVIFVGLGASVIRAAIMAWLMWLAKLIGRPAQSKHILLVTLTIYVWVEPTSLLYNASLALSFLAMIGLTMAEDIKKGKDQTKSSLFIESMKEAVFTCLAATLLTTPYIIWAFGRTNLLGIIANLIVAPVIPWLMIFGALTLFFAYPAWIALPAKGMIAFIISVSDRVAKFGALNIFLSWQNMLLLYFLIFFLSRSLSTRSVKQIRQK